MRKYLLLLLTVFISSCCVGCSNNNQNNHEQSTTTKNSTQQSINTQNNNDQNSNTPSESTTEIKKDFSDLTDKGEGSFYLSTPSGTSEDGNIPFVYLAEDTLVHQIGLDATDIDGTKISYIYVDGILNFKDQLSTTQTSINLTKNELGIGTHAVELAQYNDNKESGEIVTYKKALYEIKSLN